MAVMDLENTLRTLATVVEAMESRLESVCSPSTPETPNQKLPEAKPAAVCDLAQKIFVETEAARRCRKRLEDLLERIEL